MHLEHNNHKSRRKILIFPKLPRIEKNSRMRAELSGAEPFRRGRESE